MFAEAKLGHCNASEVIDPSRFWDWQSSPIPDDAPEIAPTSTDSRAQQPSGTTPTGFPPSMVNIVSPTVAPDPTGFATAAGVLQALGPFKDMSGMQQLAHYLETLSNNATQLASQGMKGAQTAGLMSAIRSADELTPDQKKSLMGQLIGGQVANTVQPSGGGGSASAGQSSSGGATTQTGSGSSSGNQTPQQPGQQSPVPTPAPTPTPKPTPAPKPVSSPSLSPKTRKVTLNFVYDTNDPMVGRWNVELISGGETHLEQRLINTLTGVSGVDLGNRLEFYLPSSFGGTDDVTFQISGTIVQVPTTITSPKAVYEVESWTLDRTTSKTIKRADFDKSATFVVLQTTDDASYVITTSRSENDSHSTANSNTAGLEVGVENTTEVGGTVEVATAKEAVKINAKGTFSATTQVPDTQGSGVAFTEQITFKVKRVSAAAPDVRPV